MRIGKMIRYFTKLLLLAGLLSFAGRTASADPTLKIGLLVELTGQFANNGQACRHGYEIAQELYAPGNKIRGIEIGYVYGDNQGIATAGVSEFLRMVGVEHVGAVITSRSPVGMAVNPISLQKKIPLLGILGHPGFVKQNRYAFRVWPSAAREGAALAEKAAALKKLRAAVITSEDEYFLSITEGFAARLAELGGVLAASETVMNSEQNFVEVLSRIKKSAPEVLFINVGPGQYPAALRRTAELRFSPQRLANFLVSMPDVLSSAGAAADGVVFVELDFDKPLFLKRFTQQSGGERPTAVGYACYAALATVLKAIEQASETNKEDWLYQALLRTQRLELLDGAVEYHDRELQVGLNYRIVGNRAAQRVK